MGEEFDESVDTSSFDDVSSDFSDADSFSEPMDVGDIMDDVPSEPIETYDLDSIDSGFEEDISSSEASDIADLLDDSAVEIPSDETISDVQDASFMDSSDIPTETEDFEQDAASDIADLMDEASIDDTPNDIAESTEVSEVSEDNIESIMDDAEPLSDTIEENEDLISSDMNDNVTEIDSLMDVEDLGQQDAIEDISDVDISLEPEFLMSQDGKTLSGIAGQGLEKIFELSTGMSDPTGNVGHVASLFAQEAAPFVADSSKTMMETANAQFQTEGDRFWQEHFLRTDDGTPLTAEEARDYTFLENDLTESTEVSESFEDSNESIIDDTEPVSDTIEENDDLISSDVDGNITENDSLMDAEDSIQQDVIEDTGDVNVDTAEDVSDVSTILDNADIDDTDTDDEINDNPSETDDLSDAIIEESDAIDNAPLDSDASAYDQLAAYYSSHNYGQQDYAEYSQDPEWQELNNAYLQEIGKDPIDYASDSVAVENLDENTITNNDTTSEVEEIQPIENLDGWLKDINPNFDAFDVDSPYCNNCGSCAYAVYQRLEGNSDICATAENIGYNSEMEALTGMEQVAMTPQEIEQRLLEQGAGSHAIIGIDRAEGPGHWFNAANIDGRVVAIDGQDGSITDWPPDYGDVVNWEMSIKKE